MHDEGQSFRHIADTLHISSSTVHRWVTLGVGVKKRQPKELSVVAIQHVSETVASNPVTTLAQLKSGLAQKGCVLDRRIIARVLKHLRLSRKRTARSMSSKKPASETRAFVNKFCSTMKPILSESRPVSCVDECYFSERVLPLYGYSTVGRKCVVKGPCGGWKKRSLLLSVSSDGDKRFQVFDGSVNTIRFGEFIRSLPYPPGSTIVVDNIAFHKKLDPFTQKQFQPVFTPPYSPEFNCPVENAFSKIKNAFRSMWPWTQHGRIDVDACINAAVESLTAADVRASFSRLERIVTRELDAVTPICNVQ
jgi:transposase